MAETYGKGYEAMYQGSYGPLDPEYGTLFTGYRVSTGRISAPTSPQTANQLAEVSARLSEGIRSVELQPISPQVFETIPKEHIKEIERLGKLTGADFSLHAPLIDPAGFTQEGRWSKANRAESEERIKNVIDRAHQLSPEGNIPIALHASIGIPSSEWQPVKGKPEMQSLAVVDRETGALSGVEKEERLIPRERIIPAEEALKIKNNTEWSNQITSMVHFKQQADQALEIALPIAPSYQEIVQKAYQGQPITTEEQAMLGQLQVGQQLYSDLDAHLASLYNRAYKAKIADAEAEIDLAKRAAAKAEVEKEMTGLRKEFNNAEKMIGEKPFKASEAYRKLILGLGQTNPKLYIKAEDFALRHGKETIANAALHGFKQYGDNAPIIAVENFFPGTVFSRGEELAKFIKTSRNEFIKKAQTAGYSEREAEEAAEKLIGATWDVGHINLIRKKGFPKKEVVEETKKIAPFVKHVHITDNFGFEDSHLPPGMGDVPIKEALRELEKAGFKGKEVMEAGGWVAQFKTSPTPYILEALGSPLYAAGMQPFWNQVRGVYGVPAGYNAGYGMMLPEQHFGTYGAGFSTLPMELGGQAAGKGQRFTGAPME